VGREWAGPPADRRGPGGALRVRRRFCMCWTPAAAQLATLRPGLDAVRAASVPCHDPLVQLAPSDRSGSWTAHCSIAFD